MMKNTQSNTPWLSLINVTQCALIFFCLEAAKVSLHSRCHFSDNVCIISPSSTLAIGVRRTHHVEYQPVVRKEAVNVLHYIWDVSRGGGYEVIDEDSTIDEDTSSDVEEEGTSSNDESSVDDATTYSRYSQLHPSRNPNRDGTSRTNVPDSSNAVPSSSSAIFLGNALKSVATKTFDIAATSIGGTVDIVSPKHVSRKEIVGLWRLDQQVGLLPNQPHISCAATIQLFLNGTAMTYYKEKTYMTFYKFTERSWPRSCTIEFDAFAFQGPTDKEPIKLFYRGTLRRKLLKSSIIQITGKIYEEEELRWRLRRSVQLKQIGTFTGRRRVNILMPPRAQQGYNNEANEEMEGRYKDLNGSDVIGDEYDTYDYDDDYAYDAIMDDGFDGYEEQDYP